MFKEGQRVWTIDRGWGAITKTDGRNRIFPVEVLFDDGTSYSYTKDGKTTIAGHNSSRALFFVEIPIPKEALEL